MLQYTLHFILKFDLTTQNLGGQTVDFFPVNCYNVGLGVGKNE